MQWLGDALLSIVGGGAPAVNETPLTSVSTRRAAMLNEELYLETAVPDAFANSFGFEERVEDAKLLLQQHAHVANLRYTLVPATMDEATFAC